MSSRPLIIPSRRRFLRPLTGAAVILFLLLLTPAPAAGRVRQAAAPPAEDGPFKVEGGTIFKEGKFSFEEVEPSKVAPMPKGWAAFNNKAYRIDFGEGVVVGPHVIHFRVASAPDREVFDNLRVFQAEWDKVDERFVWQHCTILAPDKHAPDFGAKTISAKAERLGVFVVARLIEPQPPVTAVADISVEIIAPSGRALGNRELAYEVKVTNRGPQDAADLILRGAGFSSDQFVSATPPARGNGRCRQDGSNYGCKLDLLEKGATAVFRLVLNPREGPRWRYPEEGKDFSVFAFAASLAATDPHHDNNEARHSLLVFPDPNLAPRVKLTAPAREELFVAPAHIKLAAEASDPDGTLTKVEFYDGAKLIGAGVPAGKNLYHLDWRDVPPGPHGLSVVVTDDGGRSDYDTTVVMVNGALTVRVNNPRPGAVFNITAKYGGEHGVEYGPLKIDAAASVGTNGRRIKEVAFVLNYAAPGMGGMKEIARPAGADGATGESRYGVTFSGLNPTSYILTVVATDDGGVATVSSPVRFRVNSAPLVRLRPEMNATTGYKAPARVTLRADVFDDRDGDGPGSKGGKVDFYADGKLIGSAATDGFSGLSSFHWTDVPPGSYAVTAVATDGDGVASVPSNPLRITVLKER